MRPVVVVFVLLIAGWPFRHGLASDSEPFAIRNGRDFVTALSDSSITQAVLMVSCSLCRGGGC